MLFIFINVNVLSKDGVRVRWYQWHMRRRGIGRRGTHTEKNAGCKPTRIEKERKTERQAARRVQRECIDSVGLQARITEMLLYRKETTRNLKKQGGMTRVE